MMLDTAPRPTSRNAEDHRNPVATAGGAMRVVTYTTLYPNEVRPNHGIFVENRLRKLVADGCVDARVVAPVPWFPVASARFGGYGDFARIPEHESRHDLDIAHPRYPTIPKIGMTAAPRLLYRWSLGAMQNSIASGRGFAPIDAHNFYPDGVAAALLGRRLNRPVVITARGSDVNLIASYDRPRRMILWAAKQAAAVITVSDALRRRLIELGAPAEKIVTLRNGVDLDTFRPVDREAAKRSLGINGRVIVTVGNVIESKGQRLVVHALAKIPDAHLLIVGDGADVPVLGALAAELGVADRLKFLGRVPHDRFRDVYGAADVSVLASVREGWPNVLLESMACLRSLRVPNRAPSSTTERRRQSRALFPTCSPIRPSVMRSAPAPKSSAGMRRQRVRSNYSTPLWASKEFQLCAIPLRSRGFRQTRRALDR